MGKIIKKKKPSGKKTPFRVIIKFKESLSVPYGSDADIDNYLLSKIKFSWQNFLLSFPGITREKVYTALGPNEMGSIMNEINEVLKNENKKYLYKDPKFQNYFVLSCPATINSNSLLTKLSKTKGIKAAYIDQSAALASAPAKRGTTEINQHYLDAAPVGIDAASAWAAPGGDGKSSVQFLDIEGGWNFNHPVFPPPPFPLPIFGLNIGDPDHGTEVLGIIFAQKNNPLGLIGIAPGVNLETGSVIFSALDPTNLDFRNAIQMATSTLISGDIMLIEGQQGNTELPLETDMAIFEIIKLATAKGIIVIEPAGNGNGGKNLDTTTRANKKGAPKKLIFKKGTRNQNSGAIMVAGATSTNPHSKLFNYGSRVDCYAWGENITTAGNPNGLTTFDGASGASAILAGAIILIQSMYLAKTGSRLDCKHMRSLLRKKSNGTSSKDKIGIMPDLNKIAAYISTLSVAGA